MGWEKDWDFTWAAPFSLRVTEALMDSQGFLGRRDTG